MLNHHPEELISAYLDGELTPDEKSEFERALAADAALRDQLAELQELSLSVQQLAPTPRPADLHASVMQAIQTLPSVTEPVSPEPLSLAGSRSAVSGHSTNGHSEAPLPNPSRSGSRRIWASWISLALIAGVGLGSIFVPRQWAPLSHGPGEMLAVQEHSEMAAQMSTFGASTEPSISLHPTDAPLMMSSTMSSDSAGDVLPSVGPATQKNAPADSVMSMSTFSAPAPAMVSEMNSFNLRGTGPAITEPVKEAPLPIVELTSEQLRQKFRELKRVPVAGNSIEIEARARTEVGETPVVVVFTVIDVQQAMNQLQVLVQKQQIRTVNDADLAASNLKQSTASQPMSAFTFEMELNEPEMAALLQSVPALDAVMYAPEQVANSAVAAAPAQNGPPMEISRASVPAQPGILSTQVSPGTQQGNADSQPANSQYVFTQVLPHEPIIAQQTTSPQITSQQQPMQVPAPASESVMSLNQAPDSIGTLGVSSTFSAPQAAPPTMKQQNVPMGRKLTNGEAARYRALIHLQKSDSRGQGTNSPQ